LNYLDALASAIRAEAEPGWISEGHTTSLFRMYAVLIRARGAAITESDVHDVRSAWALVEQPAEAAIQPFKILDPPVQAKDATYIETHSALGPVMAGPGELSTPRGHRTVPTFSSEKSLD